MRFWNFFPHRPNSWLSLAMALGMGGMVASHSDAQTLNVRVNRWLEYRQLTGTVQSIKNGRTSPARLGERLGNIGDAVHTGRNSTANLAVDTEVGFVMVSERSRVRITDFQATASGGRITELTLDQGQARLRLRPFTNPDTRFDIRTPAGVSGVRGTEFGVAVQTDGRTGVATLEGSVESSAQGESVQIPAGFQSLIVPGEPPAPPEPLRDDPFLDVRLLRVVTVDGDSVLQARGATDPVNLLFLAEDPLPTDRTGTFELQIPLPENRRVPMTVITPLGTEQAYELVVP
jgi:hypothetical protein